MKRVPINPPRGHDPKQHQIVGEAHSWDHISVAVPVARLSAPDNVLDALRDLLTIIPFGIYPTIGEVEKANAALLTILHHFQEERLEPPMPP